MTTEFKIQRRGDQLRISADLDAGHRALRRRRHGEPAYIYGPAIIEEQNAFYDNSSGYYRTLRLGKYGLALSDLIQPLYYGRAKILNRIGNFARYYGTVPSTADHRFSMAETIGDPRQTFNSIDELYLYERLKSSYITTRRKKDGAEEEFDEYFAHAMSTRLEAPITFTAHSQISFEAQIALWRWAHEREDIPLLIFVEAQTPPTYLQGKVLVERGYIDPERFLAELPDKVEVPASAVGSVWRDWVQQRSSGEIQLLEEGKLTIQSANQFASIAGRIIATSSNDVERPRLVVPAQQIAPLTFVQTDDGIGILHQKTSDIPALQTTGAARALGNLASDLLGLSTLENAVPNYRAKIGRIMHLLNEIADSGGEESQIVELGVELSALERRFHDGKERLGELTVEEVASFLVESKSFLSRFRSWLDYQTKSHLALSRNSTITAEISRDLLNEFVQTDGTLTAEARRRLDEFTNDDAVDLEDPLKREGYASSAENLMAEAAKAALGATKAGAVEIGRETRKSFTSELGKNAALFLVRNAGKLHELAHLRDTKWLQMVLDLMSHK